MRRKCPPFIAAASKSKKRTYRNIWLDERTTRRELHHHRRRRFIHQTDLIVRRPRRTSTPYGALGGGTPDHMVALAHKHNQLERTCPRRVCESVRAPVFRGNFLESLECGVTLRKPKPGSLAVTNAICSPSGHCRAREMCISLFSPVYLELLFISALLRMSPTPVCLFFRQYVDVFLQKYIRQYG